MEGVEEAIQATRQAIDAMPNDHPDRASLLLDLANKLGDRFLTVNNTEDLEEAIQITQRVINTTPNAHADGAKVLNTLNIYAGEIKRRRRPTDNLDNAIDGLRQDIDSIPDDHPLRTGVLNVLGFLLEERCLKMGTLVNLDESIEIARQIVEDTPQDRPERALLLDTLALRLHARFYRSGVMTDLEETIQIRRQAIDATPGNHIHQAWRLDQLGLRLWDRFQQTGSMANFEEAISVARMTIDATPLHHSRRPDRLYQLGLRLQEKFRRTRVMADLQEAISVARQTVAATPDDHTGRSWRLNKLGLLIWDRYGRTQDMSDLEEAMDIGRQAIASAPPQDHSGRAVLLINRANQFGDRFNRTGNVADLEEAIQVSRQAVDTVPENHPDRAEIFNGLGVRLGVKFNRFGDINDLEEAIGIGHQVVDLVPPNDANWAGMNINLSSQLAQRFTRIGAISDIEESIDIVRRTVDAITQSHPDRLSFLEVISLRLWQKFTRTRDPAILEESLDIIRQVVASAPQDHPERARFLDSLGGRLTDKFNWKETLIDIQEAVDVHRQAVALTSEDHRARMIYLHNLGLALGAKYSKTRAIVDLDESIKVVSLAIESAPHDYPQRAGYLNNLGDRLADQFNRTGSQADLDACYRCFANSLAQETAPISYRITAGRVLLSSEWIRSDPLNILDYAEASMKLLPKLTQRSLMNADKQHLLLQAVGIASNAAALALMMMQSATKAVAWLEIGRGILASGLQDLRTDTSALQKKHPVLAASFENSRAILDASIQEQPNDAQGGPGLSMQLETEKRLRAHAEFEKTVQEIRNQPGFDRFLLPLAEDEILAAAANGLILMINVSPHRCDALIVSKTEVQEVELSDNLYDEIQERRGYVSSPSTTMLQWLWDRIVDPVLTRLGILECPAARDQWPRVWWIPTGPLVGFPLHAAGYHLERQGQTTLDRVVSSYAMSLRSITASTQKPQQSSREVVAGSKIALVTMTDTPNQSRLDFASEETSTVQAVCESMGLKPVFPTKQEKDEVLSILQTSSIFHFAGHGGTERDPLKSLLLLEDWEKNPLTVDSLLQTNLSSETPFLAYLSACGTGEVQDKQLLDENIHLAAAYQLAGFRHVIGTLWSVNDSVCVDMARKLYQGLQNEGFNDEAVREGLHRASRELRDLWVQSEEAKSTDSAGTRLGRDVELIDDPGRGEAVYWIPYVHYGA